MASWPVGYLSKVSDETRRAARAETVRVVITGLEPAWQSFWPLEGETRSDFGLAKYIVDTYYVLQPAKHLERVVRWLNGPKGSRSRLESRKGAAVDPGTVGMWRS